MRSSQFVMVPFTCLNLLQHFTSSREEKNEFRNLRFLTQKMNLSFGYRFRRRVVLWEQVLGFWSQRFVPSSDIDSIWSDRHGDWTSDVDVDFAAFS